MPKTHKKKLKSINCRIGGTDKRTKIDLSFYPIFKLNNWCIDSNGYVMTNILKNGKRCKLYLHHHVYDFDPKKEKGLVMDHKYRLKLDNRRKMLRKVTRRINNINKSPRSTNTGWDYIHYDYKHNSYDAVYRLNGNIHHKCVHIPSFQSDIDAFYEAFEFVQDLKDLKRKTTTDPDHRKAFCYDENDSSDGESINEEDYEFRINIERLNINNKTDLYNINHRKNSKRFVVRYYNENGKPLSKSFCYGPKSPFTEESARSAAIEFRDANDKYYPRTRKTNKSK